MQLLQTMTPLRLTIHFPVMLSASLPVVVTSMKS